MDESILASNSSYKAAFKSMFPSTIFGEGARCESAAKIEPIHNAIRTAIDDTN
jgi:hypothetical protein